MAVVVVLSIGRDTMPIVSEQLVSK